VIEPEYECVLFDLFGTLVRPFDRVRHVEKIKKCAELLGVRSELLHKGWVESFRDRCLGAFGSPADNFRWILERHGVRTSDTKVQDAQREYMEFTARSLEPLPGAVEELAWLQDHGTKLGLVSNCGPDVPLVWSASVLGPFFAHCTFSCREGVVKPDGEIYRRAVDGIGSRPERTLYVGDGSDSELSGAAACGLEAVLIVVDFSGTYDTQRAEVDEWAGARVHSFSEIRGLKRVRTREDS
jgi:putative hydrolase of the HAD superfamily